MVQDLRFAFRLIIKERWVSGVAIMAVALGIGVNATMNISDDRAWPEQVRGTWLTSNAFRILQEQPLLGRDFVPGDERKGADPVVIIGHRMWMNRYGADPSVLGKSLRINGQPAAIIGVMPASMMFPNNTEVWAPFIPSEAQGRRNVRPLSVFGRLADGSSRDEAQAELNGIAQQFAAAYPDTNKDLVAARVETFTERFVGGQARVMFLVVMGAVCFVLLIACANVANLLLSRSAHRAREIAVRIALGASRRRVVRQLLVESVLLAVIGGSIGLLLAVAGVRVFDAAVQDPGKPFWIIFKVDYVVFGYMAAICVLTAILFGLAPALHVSKTNTNDVLKESGRGSAGTRRARWLSGVMVVVELALTVVLLAGAGLLIRSFIKMYSLDLGISTDHLMTMRMQLPESKYATPDARRAFYEQLEPRLAAIPGVEAVAITTSVPPFGTGQRRVEIDGRPALSSIEGQRTPDEPLNVATVTISPQFFEAVRVTMRRGRSFRDTDGAPCSEAVVINERMAAQFFAGEDPIGRRLRLPPREPPPGQPPAVWRTIVGISPSIRHSAPQDVEPAAIVYLPYRQEPPSGASLLVRSQLPPGSVMDAVRRTVQAIDRDQPVFTIQTLEQLLAENRWPYRIFGVMFAVFGAIALVLSAVGLYAVMAYSVTQRTQEIGVRVALGAEGRQVSWMILKRGLLQLAVGLTAGLAGAFALSRVMRRLVIQITPTDPVTFTAITILLAVVSIAACLLPARRATRVDPPVALRAE